MRLAPSAVWRRSCSPANPVQLIRGAPPSSSPAPPQPCSPLLPAAQPEWLKVISDMEADIGSNLHWECAAAGKPRPTVRWLRDGDPLSSQVGDLGLPSTHPAHLPLLTWFPHPPDLLAFHTLATLLGQLGCHRVVLGASLHPRVTWPQAGQLDRVWRVQGPEFRPNSATKALCGPECVTCPSGFRVQMCGEARGICASWDSRWPWIGLGMQAPPPGSPVSTASTP